MKNETVVYWENGYYVLSHDRRLLRIDNNGVTFPGHPISDKLKKLSSNAFICGVYEGLPYLYVGDESRIYRLLLSSPEIHWMEVSGSKVTSILSEWFEPTKEVYA